MTQRTVFFISDGTGITAETLGNSLMTQFEGLEYKRITLPFIDSEDAARMALGMVNRAAEQDRVRPIVYATLTDPTLFAVLGQADARVIDVFGAFLPPLEDELGRGSTHAKGRSHGLIDKVQYDVRMEALNFALNHDDGMSADRVRQADVVLVGVSRSGKTPTCIYLAMQFGVLAANYPLTEEDLARQQLSQRLARLRSRLYGLTIDPERLHRIRNERRPNSAYASLDQCRREVHEAEALLRLERVRSRNVTSVSIEEIASHILQEMSLKRRLY